MSGWDEGVVFAGQYATRPVSAEEGVELSRDQAARASRDFIRNFVRDGVFVYREALLQNYNNGRHYLEVDLDDLKTMNDRLYFAVQKHPNEYIPPMEHGAQTALDSLVPEAMREGLPLPSIQVLFTGELLPTPIRGLTAADVNHLVLVPGIVTSASRTRPKATSVRIQCSKCKHEKSLPAPPGFGTVKLPRACTNLKESNEDGGAPPSSGVDCGIDSYVILPDKCKYLDQQTLKLQEAPEMVPTGEMPRTMTLAVERSLADKVAPGTRISAIGVVCTFQQERGGRGQGRGSGAGAGGGVAVRIPYIRVVGVMVHEDAGGRGVADFTPEQEAHLRAMAKEPGMYERMANSIAPSISGDYTDDIKRAILCLLLAGSRKLLPDGMRLRGDINVLMLGDPSTAKSQFLKFVEKVAPVGVYTSGKGSSAAGLTASVIKDARGEFYLEGGAMVLADGGVVCIDEFDKMREEDRVAIHEAMEQQTISVAKAGITTILNSRAAVLAAANPVFGRYDDTKSAADNIDLLPTILSRFDLIFIVRDIRNEARDAEIARHVMRVHMSAGGAGNEGSTEAAAAAAAGDIDIVTMRRFIAYARSKCAPRLSPEAAAALQTAYVEVRQAAKGREAQAREAALATSEEHGVIPVTVRQLEAMVRITEAVAKSTLCAEATPEHVAEALRLFRVSTLNAAASGLSTVDGNLTPSDLGQVKAIEGRIARLLRVGDTSTVARLRQQLGQGAGGSGGFSEEFITLALKVLERRQDVQLYNERKSVRRLK